MLLSANSAAAGTGGLWFLSYLPYLFIQPRYETMTRGAKMGSCFLHNIGLSLGAQLIGMFEGKGEDELMSLSGLVKLCCWDV